MTALRIPSATYRLQFNHLFNFKNALEFISYFRELGISDLYASPIMKSTAGSLHGYDIVNPCELNPEVGNEEELEKLIKGLQEFGMGFLLDIVPNHTCIANQENSWWQDVLENGPSSLYAHYFNIMWDPPKENLKNKVLLAVLDQQYGKVIENQDLKLVYEEGTFFIQYKTNRFPVNPVTWPTILNPVVDQLLPQLGEKEESLLELQSIITALEHLPIDTKNLEERKERAREKEIIKKRLATLVEKFPLLGEAIQSIMASLNGQKGDPHSFDDLEELLNQQAYRLSFWRVTNDEINYRRFFDINTLINMRMENEEVFEAMHVLVLKYIQRGWITGLRIDHIDGLFDPQDYFARLQKACALALGENNQEAHRHFYLLVEKILIGNEKLRPEWLICGTTGYDGLNLLNNLFVMRENHLEIKQIYEDFIHHHHYEMINLLPICKKLILIVSMSSELHILARQLEKVSEQHRWSRDYTLETLRSALRDVIACFPVYRSYIRLEDSKVQEEDREYIKNAIQGAKRLNLASDPSTFEFIESVLLLEDPPGLTEEEILYRRDFVIRFQQLTGPVTAMGVEDTAFYRCYPLASLNEVGMDPLSFGIDSDVFHDKNQERLQTWPHTLLATSTHDTKRSEDVRARINVLSENPESWKQALSQWKSINQSRKITIENQKVPDANEEFLLYQTLIGTWPLYPMDANARAQYIDRIEKYLLKAIKEAKIHTSWINPNEAYEKGVAEFIHHILDLEPDNHFLKEFEKFVPPIIRAGMFNSLSQTLLKMTIPGIPDFYQGSELWEFNLVDPDNRRPIDYSNRHHLLAMLKQKASEDRRGLVTHLMETPEDGRIKLYLTSQVLNFRHQHSSLFQEGNYLPFEVTGEKSKHIVAFSRTKNEEQIIVAVGRFYMQLLDSEYMNPIGKLWTNTALVIPLEGKYEDILSGLTFEISKDQPLFLEEVFSKLPLVLLQKIS